MRMNNPVARWIIILLAIITPLCLAWYVHFQRDNISCESHLIIVDDRSVLDLLIAFRLRSGSGTYDSTGEYSQSGKPTIAIKSRLITGAKRATLLWCPAIPTSCQKKTNPSAALFPTFSISAIAVFA